MPRPPPEFLVLAMDVGSSSTRTALVDDSGRLVRGSNRQRGYTIRYTAHGAAEVSPNVLRRAAGACVSETLRWQRNSAALHHVPVRAISGCSFWHSLLGLDRDGKPTTAVFTWADSRSHADAAQLRAEFSERAIQLRTGCMLRASFWPAKLRWLRRTDRAAFNRVARWVSPVTWVSRELFDVETTSHSMASGTGLYNLVRRAWDDELCDACRVTPVQLGTIGDVSARGAARRSYVRETTIFPAIGDGAASNLGSGADADHRIAINIGTSAAVRIVESRPQTAATELPFGLFRYVVDDKRTLLGGALSNAGNLRQWCLRELNLRDESAAEKALSRRAAASDSITVLPFWVSERAPTWPDGLHGVIAGLAQTTTAADIFRAVTTSTYYRLAEILAEIEEALGHEGSHVIVSGGVLRSPASLKLLADCLGRDIRVSRQMESSLRGAAIHAIQQLGGTVAPLPAEKLVAHDATRAEQHRSGRRQQSAAEAMFAARTETLRP